MRDLLPIFVEVAGLVLTDRTLLNWNSYDLGFWWIDGLKYATNRAADDDRDLLASLLSDPWYHHNYCSPRGDEPDRVGPPLLHGPYWLDKLSVGSFLLRQRTDALAILARWSEPMELPPEFVNRMGAVVDDLLPAGWTVYELSDLRAEAQHEYGFVVGADGGFSEFIAVSPDRRLMNVLVATDD